MQDSVRAAAWGLGLFAGVNVLGVALEATAMAAGVAQAVAAEWGAGRLGVTWSDPLAKTPEPTAIAKRAGLGALVGAVMAVVVTLALATTGAVLLERGHAAFAAIAISIFTAGLHAMRDELLLHGLTLRVLVGVRSPIVRTLACGVTSAAAALGDPSTSTPLAVVVQGLLGVVFGALWVRDRGAWPAWAAHTAWLAVTGALLGGGALEAHVAATTWGGGDAGPLGGAAAAVALAPLALGALSGTRRRRS